MTGRGAAAVPDQPPPRPTREQVAAAANTTIPDVIGPHLRLLFCGINPGLYTAASGHHFGRPGNRFWKLLFEAGFVDRPLAPWQQGMLPEMGIGITNLVARATAAATDLGDDELRSGWERLAATVRRRRPAFVAFCGIGAYRVGSGRTAAGMGPQPEALEGARVWVLPNPSGLQASYSFAAMLAEYTRLREAALPRGRSATK